MIQILSLFSGIGALDLAVEHVTGGLVAYQIERHPWRRRVLERHWPDAKRHDDVRSFDGRVPVNVLCGGWPCQDVSNAGLRAGLAGARSGLWSEVARIVRAAHPRLVLLENVEALRTRGLPDVLADLVSAGYDVEWSTLRACDVGAPHRRDRIWIAAWPIGERPDLPPAPAPPPYDWPPSRSASREEWTRWLARNPDAEPGIVRVRTETAPRRLRQAALGDSVCVAQAIAAYTILLSSDRTTAKGPRVRDLQRLRLDHGPARPVRWVHVAIRVAAGRIDPGRRRLRAATRTAACARRRRRGLADADCQRLRQLAERDQRPRRRARAPECWHAEPVDDRAQGHVAHPADLRRPREVPDERRPAR